jgi:Fur family ferric uptake transcriptional regulator
VPQSNPHEILRDYISEHGLKSSRQRELIADVFFESGGHLRVDELLDRVRDVDPKIGQATVYRTMKLLTKCGLAAPRHFGDGHTRYEPVAPDEEEHHDHLICTSCNRIVEFLDERIEELQERVAADHGFTLTRHKMELYGLCEACQKKPRARRRPPSS